ncbi:hypothetical protein DXH95_09760 [Sphingorhabdus pulchriflava]|uniref:Uncharacterized protein n=1 Tax=Sphingorhabdus pulchriflava TaxID=2292257 RepID=A0A371BJ41_9SPHN|nr:hypothetical protein DXH95_09760 [Sphingorhabdus pulchriflava]
MKVFPAPVGEMQARYQMTDKRAPVTAVRVATGCHRTRAAKAMPAASAFVGKGALRIPIANTSRSRGDGEKRACFQGRWSSPYSASFSLNPI